MFENNLLISIIVTVIAFIVLSVVLWLKIYGTKKIGQYMREVLFYVRWWLIGKNFCDVSQKTKKFLTGMRHLVWGFILVSVSLLLADIIKTLETVLLV